MRRPLCWFLGHAVLFAVPLVAQQSSPSTASPDHADNAAVMQKIRDLEDRVIALEGQIRILKSQQAAPGTVPASDTISPNPPNGMTFAGSGRYQLYRQGNITWRLDTETGRSCVIFATDEEWKKPRVYKAGCGKI